MTKYKHYSTANPFWILNPYWKTKGNKMNEADKKVNEVALTEEQKAAEAAKKVAAEPTKALPLP